MSTSEHRSTWGAVPTKAVAAAAALALVMVPVPSSAGGAGGAGTRTTLLTVASGQSLASLAHQVSALGGRVVRTLSVADTLLVELPEGTAVPAGSVEVPNGTLRVNSAALADTPATSTYLQTIGAPTSPSTGSGVVVALVDTGVADVPGLEHVEHINVSGDTDGDGLGHGTFLAGLIGGRGSHPGVAPGASLVDVKVADAEGTTSLATVLEGLQAIADRGDVDVLNLSLSSGSPLPPSFDPLTRALDRLWRSGVTVVAAAGNDGPAKGSVSSPGNDPVLLTVGALDEHASAAPGDDTVAEFSARGTKYSSQKPDLVAPGVSLVSTAAPGSLAVTENPQSLVEGGQYMRGSGTSMAAAVVSGSAAAVLDVNPALSPNGVKALLRSTARTSAALEARDGAGRGALDLGAAVAAAPGARGTADGATDPADGDWGPAEEDAEAWAAFAAAWESGDLAAVKAAWADLSWQTKQWAARSWSMAVVASSVGLPQAAFEARSWSARSWSFDEWLARSWSARSWSARSWSFEEWLARSWSARSWSARSWSARSWSADEWLARSWSARSWSADDWAARSWSARSWSARSWSARSWSDFAWEARSWSARSWSARSWSARSWSIGGTDARSWSVDGATARSWS